VTFARALVHLRRPVEAELGKACFAPQRRRALSSARLVASTPSRNSPLGRSEVNLASIDQSASLLSSTKLRYEQLIKQAHTESTRTSLGFRLLAQPQNTWHLNRLSLHHYQIATPTSLRQLAFRPSVFAYSQ
jgi:hypothetical protein